MVDRASNPVTDISRSQALARALLLRGSNDFADLPLYRRFVAEVVGRANADRILVGDTDVVARGGHAVMRAQRSIAPGLMFGGVAVRLRKAADRLSLRCSCGAPPKPTALPIRGGQSEMMEPEREVQTSDGDTERVGIGEIREALLPRWMLLAEDHLALGTVQRLPNMNPALQGRRPS